MAILNNLYPPIVSTYADAFLADSGDINKDTCKIYFSISAYNSFSDIKNAQVTVTNQNTNISVLDEEKYPCGIMLTDIYEDLTRLSNDKYYIKIKKSDIENGTFEINQYYKIQIRFTDAAAENISLVTPQAIDSWLSNNMAYFSEWSTVILARAISTPILNINGFDNSAENNFWMAGNVDIVGKLTFKNSTEQEVLKSYQLKLYDEKNNLIADSGLIYSNYYSAINEINYTFKYNFVDEEKYILYIKYMTENFYTDEFSFDLTIVENNKNKIDGVLTVEQEIEEGCNIIHIVGNEPEESFTGNITIRRASSETNFTIWEDVYTFSLENQPLTYYWIDKTIKSGVWYKYGMQKRDSLGNRGLLIINETPSMVVFEDMFLIGQGKQLKIKFNPQIQSMQNIVAENKIDTIGSKYTYINRNGNMNYKQFPIAGTISFFMDKQNYFTSREEIYGENVSLYNSYNDENRINPFIDITYERDFRDKVIEFLNDNSVKLFKSATEGNILVKLTNISFSPEQSLGRQIYSFNCTANEIDECSIENYNKYNIQNCGELDEVLSYQKGYLAQYNKEVSANVEILNDLNKYFQKYNHLGYITKIDYLNYIKLEIEDPPYLIGEQDGEPYIINDKDIIDISNTNAILGYLFYINNKPIIINPEGIYELKGENIEITSLKSAKQLKINLDYYAYVSQSEDLSQLIKVANYFKRVGQKWGSFKYGESVYQKIWNKYFEKYTNYYQTLISLKDIRVEADAGTVLYMKEKGENSFQRHVIGKTQYLELKNKDTEIEGIYFLGKHFEEATPAEQLRKTIPDGKFYDTNIVIDETFDKSTLIKNGVYILGDKYLKAYDHFIESLKLKILEEVPPFTVKINENRVNEENQESYLLLNPILSPIDEDGGIIIDEDNIVLISHLDTGEYYIEAKDKPITNNQVSMDEDDLNQTTYQKMVGHSLHAVSDDDIDEVQIRDSEIEDTEPYPLILRKILQEQPTYEMTLHNYYDNIFGLILQQEVDNNNKYIWYNNRWYPFTAEHDIVCSVEAIVDYYCNILKGSYV